MQPLIIASANATAPASVPISVPTPAEPPASASTSSDYELLDPDKMGAAYDKVRADSSIQWDFPEYKVEPPPEWLSSLFNALSGMGTGLKILFYVVLALLALYLIYLLVPPVRDYIDGLIRRKPIEEEEEDWAPQMSVAVELLAEADKLAAEGRYAEAVHLLLGRSIEDIGRRRPQLLRPALTARDIAQHPDLPQAARGAFTTIANVVELSHFGRRPVDQSGWQQCRDAYSRFALRESWSNNEMSSPTNNSTMTAGAV